jgi:hypothetical protein
LDFRFHRYSDGVRVAGAGTGERRSTEPVREQHRLGSVTAVGRQLGRRREQQFESVGRLERLGGFAAWRLVIGRRQRGPEPLSSGTPK